MSQEGMLKTSVRSVLCTSVKLSVRRSGTRQLVELKLVESLVTRVLNFGRQRSAVGHSRDGVLEVDPPP